MTINGNDSAALREYYSNLFKIQSNNATSVATLVPGTEEVYSVDLNTRVVAAPKQVIVQSDHAAEILYFKIPRYYDNIDLSSTVCVIQYINANKEPYFYAVPYYDVDTYSAIDLDNGIDQPMMIIPWVLSGMLTAVSGTVQFSMRFFLLEDNGQELIYQLNTLPQTMTVVANNIISASSAEIGEDVINAIAKSQAYDDILQEAKKAIDKDIYWDVLS